MASSKTKSTKYQATYRRAVRDGWTSKPWKAPRNNWEEIVKKLTKKPKIIPFRSVGVASRMASYVQERYNGVTCWTSGNKLYLRLT